MLLTWLIDMPFSTPGENSPNTLTALFSELGLTLEGRKSTKGNLLPDTYYYIVRRCFPNIEQIFSIETIHILHQDFISISLPNFYGETGSEEYDSEGSIDERHTSFALENDTLGSPTQGPFKILARPKPSEIQSFGPAEFKTSKSS